MLSSAKAAKILPSGEKNMTEGKPFRRVLAPFFCTGLLMGMLISLSEGARISHGAGHGETCRIPLAAHFVVEEVGLR
jgi:hypothetical protein